ncbi:MAG: FHA domain-containing protein [Microbacteriaceae bacterium]|nr:FHA domain-containing protein [Microbacteriaceae bacterium]
MSELTLLVLRLAFLLVLWGFIFIVVFALRTDLFGQRVRRQVGSDQITSGLRGEKPSMAGEQRLVAAGDLNSPTPANALPNNSAPAATALTATRLVIVTGPKSGLELSLEQEPLTIGRATESGLVIRDDYTSTHHARLMLLNDSWVIQDLDSTNGTFLDGTRVSVPTHVPLNTPVKIGSTSFELRR